ncbi:hypothetical protein ACMBCM_07455, partial [Spiroplasma sp. K1]
MNQLATEQQGAHLLFGLLANSRSNVSRMSNSLSLSLSLSLFWFCSVGFWLLRWSVIWKFQAPPPQLTWNWMSSKLNAE